MNNKKTGNDSHFESANDDAVAKSSSAPSQFEANSAMDELRAMVIPSSSLAAMGLEAAAKKNLPSGQTLGDALKSFIRQLTDSLSQVANDLSSLEVRTFSSDDMSQVHYDLNSGKFIGPVKPRALTRISLDGDTDIVVPEKGDELDETLWAAHVSMVKEAQATRAQFIGSMAEMATRLIALFS
ncbi:MAG: hypothetical protein D6709_03425 [Chloroflexi bacterium]|jgi:hypothetical protein|uniref:Uncharacterized protein n=1 Tax=Candidatus Thermofonsia Clade 3 bacterium TaxID=2364212 RepID=A0A2M8QAZ5_9CHLR|nr:hypothetical protein [Candidatus Roseilinea sp. NK_OTU-006]PJF46971.1 MAG: hypothetical protein CUN48_11040 [Candidatus Thermofonsia Clade 3 bacterium]RMG65176.1 MAG: hypothetical protein D6709_03425 [Chloroflexota bacterium]